MRKSTEVPNALLGVIWATLLLSGCAAPSLEIQVHSSSRSPGGDGEAENPRRASESSTVGGRVLHVVDGDTFQARIGGKSTTMRLIGVDAPELAHQPEAAECFGAEASSFTEARLAHRRIGLQYDAERIDPYGRTLVYVWIGKRLFNEDLVRMGFATVVIRNPNLAQVTRLVEAERKARRDGLGLWGACLRPVNTGADWRDLSDVG